jgi:hypothetical protein
MDTAQRGLGLDWPTAAELARRSAHAAHEVGGDIAAGAGTDHLDLRTVGPGSAGRAAVRDAYRMQLHAIGDTGATPIVMASRALVVAATSADDYLEVYDDLLSDADAPVILHWLGPMFDAALTGYWGSEDLDEATTTFMTIVARHASKVAGVKVSLLDRDREIAMRGALPPGVRMYTGDDFNYPDLIVGDETGHSDALLGVFAAIHPAASAALQALDRGDSPHARAILDSTVALGRHLFEAPTSHYKTGIAFLSWLNGYQSGFTMLAGTHSSRSMSHLSRVLVLADEAGLLTDPELAALRMERLLTVHGVLA